MRVRDLSEIRVELDEIDSLIMDLFNRRQELSADVAAYKKDHGLPIKDKEREREKLERIRADKRPLVSLYGPELMSCLMELSCKEQSRLQ